jgi:hypothetical protein
LAIVYYAHYAAFFRLPLNLRRTLAADFFREAVALARRAMRKSSCFAPALMRSCIHLGLAPLDLFGYVGGAELSLDARSDETLERES